MVEPSGDHAGAVSSAEVAVRRRVVPVVVGDLLDARAVGAIR